MSYGRVTPPARRPNALGLLASANRVADGSNTDPDGAEWVRGFSYAPEPCLAGGVISSCAGTSVSTTSNPSQIDVQPFYLQVATTCSTFGNPDQELQDERAAITRRALDAAESRLLEAELWSGTLSQSASLGNRYLTDSNRTLPEGARPIGYVTALQVLEQAGADGTNDQLMIHATPRTVTLWDQNGLITRRGNVLYTVHDTIVVPGRGYPGTKPANTDTHAALSSDAAWAYVTNVVQLRRTDYIAEPSMDLTRTTNVLVWRAQRLAAVTWDCVQAGVWVDHTTAISTTGS